MKKLFRMIIPQFPGFNIYSHIASKTTAIGPLYIATMAAALPDWEVEVIDENNYRYPGPRDENGSPDHRLLQTIRRADAVGFYGSLTSTIPRLYTVAKFYRGLGIPTIAGGHHFIAPEQTTEGLAAGVDAIAHGEGEYLIQEFLAHHRDRAAWPSIAGLSFLDGGTEVHTPARPPLTDLETLPFPDFHLLKYARVRVFPLNRIRGCGMDCEFCAIKGKPRWNSPEKLFANLVNVIERHRRREFFIVDDLFSQDRAGTKRFCELAIDWQQATGKRLDLSIQVRLDAARDPELLRLMRAAGVLMVAIGYESVIDEELDAMEKHSRARDMLELTRAYREAGFMVHGMFIFGYPARSGQAFTMPIPERVRRFKRFIRQAKLDTIQVLLPVPLPGTALRTRLQAQGRLYPREFIGWEYYDGNFPTFEPDPPFTAESQQRAMRSIMGSFYHFHHMLMVGLRTVTFPAYFVPLLHIRRRWDGWYRAWRNNVRGFGGWLLLRKWTDLVKKDRFFKSLADARARLRR